MLDRLSETPGAKAYRGGTHRTVSPRETLRRVAPLMRDAGITRVANVTGLDSIGIPVAVACRPNARSLSVSQGKGLTLDAAKASAVMESLECLHAETICAPLRLGSARELSKQIPLVDVTRVNRTTDSRFAADPALLWMEGLDLMSGGTKWVPYELVHLDTTLTGVARSGIFPCSSNGLASGNHVLEAVSHAVCELIERDALTLWGLGGEDQRARTRVDSSTIDAPGCTQVLARFEAADVAVAVWDITSDVGVPCFNCLIVDRSADGLRALYSAGGQGCHPTREVALLRALTEAAQTRLTLIAGSRDDVSRRHYEQSTDVDAIARDRALVAGGVATRHFRAAPTFSGDSFAADVQWELERLSAAHIRELVVFELTRPSWGIPVVKVVANGLEGIHSFPGYAFGHRARRAMCAQQETA